jgi:iron complex outermembrane recepter protein
MTKTRIAVLSAVATWSLTVSQGALARSEAAAATSEPETGLAEIVVTAQRRLENSQDVPISVSAIQGDALQSTGIGGVATLTQAVPSVQMMQTAFSALLFIRGVGNTSGAIGEEGANAVYVNGVYMGDITQATSDFNNVKRIEVLKGPQGTLFGRNSSGGLINIITKEPGDRVELSARAGYANYDTYKGEFYAATPLGEAVSADVALMGRNQHEGWGKNIATGQDFGRGWRWGVRSKIVWRPSDAVKIVAAGDYMRAKETLFLGFPLYKGTVGSGGFTYNGDYNINTTDPVGSRIRNWGTSLTVEAELGGTTLTSITAYRDLRTRGWLDADYVPTKIVRSYVPAHGRTFQQELRLASASTDPLGWQVGAFFYDAMSETTGQAVRGIGVGGVNSGFDIFARMKTRSYAAFGEVTYKLTDTTTVIGGIRYTHEKRRLNGRQVAVGQAAGSPLQAAFTVAPTQQEVSFDEPTYRLALKQDLNDSMNVYASYNRGFKSGLWAVTATPTNPPVRPQITDAFELGFKSTLLDRKLRLNLAAFHYTVKDYQIRTISPIGSTTLLLNAASVKIDGVEGDIEFVPVQGLRLSGSATYLNSRFTSFPRALFNYALPASCSPAPGRSAGPATGGFLTCIGNASGNRTPLAPQFAGSLSAQYDVRMGDGQLSFSTLFAYNSGVHFEVDNRLHQKSYGLLNGSIRYKSGANWGLEFWVNNLTDKRYYISGSTGNTGAYGDLGAPRTYGVNLTLDL